MDFQKTGYDTWKENINKVLLYKHFQSQITNNTQEIFNKMSSIQKKVKEATNEDKQNYIGLLSSYFNSFTNIEQLMNDNLQNTELLEELYKQNNIDVSYASFLKWIKKENNVKI